jgi:hypothetical protein
MDVSAATRFAGAKGQFYGYLPDLQDKKNSDLIGGMW